ncbi:MAG: hypothetical protein ACR2RE_21100 [Geminicoccaceae bacterium]
MNDKAYDPAEYARRFWDAANLITGFAVAQALAYLYAIGGNETFRNTVTGDKAQCWVVGAAVFFTFVYMALIYVCTYCELHHSGSCWRSAQFGIRGAACIRMLAILLFNLGVVCATLKMEPTAPVQSSQTSQPTPDETASPG